MAERACVKRLQKEYRALCKEPVPHILARPNPNDILEWHYVLEGSEGTPFAGGIYYGKVKFPSDYPFKPPGISMTTPNGRFATQKRICMSMSDFHPETWNPMWSVSSILTGLLSFMVVNNTGKIQRHSQVLLETQILLDRPRYFPKVFKQMDNSPTTGSVSTTVAEKQRLARASLAFNCKSPMFRKMFPEYVERYNQLQNVEKLNSDRMSEKELPHATSAPEGKEKEDNRVLDERNQRHTNKIPFWLLFFIFSVLCAIMALPLLLI